jgi:hypothetical protein
MTTTRALIATGFLAGFAVGIWIENGTTIIVCLLGVLAVLLSADRRDRSDGARSADLPSFHRQER